MKNLSSLPLQQQFNLLMQDVNKLKKEKHRQDENRGKYQPVNHEKEIKNILFKSESQNNIPKMSNSTITHNLSKLAAIDHKKKVMQEISNIKRIRDPIANYQELFRDAYVLSQIEDTSYSKKPAQMFDDDYNGTDYNVSGTIYAEKMATYREKTSSMMDYMDNVQTLPKYQSEIPKRKLASSASTQFLGIRQVEKENKYTTELRKLVLERKSLRAVQRL